MEKLLFQYQTLVSFQGDHVFHLLEYSPNKYSSFKIDGFGEEILVRDFRSRSVNAIGRILDNDGKGVNEFSEQFNVPALIKVFQENSDKLRFDLFDSEVPDPEFRFWVAAGIGDEIPAYDYYLKRIAPLTEKNYSFLALYKKPQSTLNRKVVHKNICFKDPESSLLSSEFWTLPKTELSATSPNI